MPSSAATLAALRPLLRQNWSASCLYSSVYLALLRAGLLNCVFMWALLGFLTLSPLSVKLGQPYRVGFRPCPMWALDARISRSESPQLGRHYPIRPSHRDSKH